MWGGGGGGGGAAGGGGGGGGGLACVCGQIRHNLLGLRSGWLGGCRWVDVGGVTWMGGRDLPGLGSPGAEHVEQGEVGPRRHHRGAGGNDPRRRRSQQLPRRNTVVSKMLP